MDYLPVVLVLIGLVVLMAGAGGKGLEAGRQILLVLIGLLVLVALFSLLLERISPG
jgi:hypothetical protein